MKMYGILVCLLVASVYGGEQPKTTNKIDTTNKISHATGRTFSTVMDWGQERMNDMYSYFFGDDDFYDYYDYHDNRIDSAGSEHSSYVSYIPRQDVYDYSDETSWADTMMNAAMVMVPLGLLLTAVPTGIFTLAIRRRSMDDSWISNEVPVDTTTLPLLRAMETSDIMDILPQLASTTCQQKLFCELATVGKRESSSISQKALYYTSTLTPNYLAKRMGMLKLFNISKQGRCENIYCSLTEDTTKGQQGE